MGVFFIYLSNASFIKFENEPLIGKEDIPYSVREKVSDLEDKYEIQENGRGFVEKNTPPDNNKINIQVSQSSVTQDTDNDGVNDAFDIDDDNDGILDLDECGVLQFESLNGDDFSFRQSIRNGSLSRDGVDVSDKWGLPPGSVIVSVDGASTDSASNFVVGKEHPVVFSFSGTVPVQVKASHSIRLNAMIKDGISSLDGVPYQLINTRLFNSGFIYKLTKLRA